MNGLYPDKETLLEYGFEKIPDEKIIIHPHENYEGHKQQWRYKEVMLNIDLASEKTRVYFYDKQTPQYSLQIKNDTELKEVITHLDRGKSIVDLLAAIQKHRAAYVKQLEDLKINKRYLEEFRYNNIGSSHFIVKAFPNQKVFMTYEKHAMFAFHSTMNDIANLENAFDVVSTGSQSHQAISFWYLTLESYINALLKLCCIKLNKKFESYRKKTLQGRLSSLILLLEIDIKRFNQNKIITKIDEFSLFRNELFHDRHFGEEITFKHTSFSPIPIFSCQVDVIQAFLIVLETASMLQLAIAGIDNMPTTILRNNNTVIWEQIDVAYKKIIQPYFEAVLDKHMLSTRLNLELSELERFQSTLFQKSEIMCELTVDQEAEFEFFLNNKPTNFGSTFYNGYLDSLNQKPGTLKLNKVMLD
jgi:hypothetical protein